MDKPRKKLSLNLCGCRNVSDVSELGNVYTLNLQGRIVPLKSKINTRSYIPTFHGAPMLNVHYQYCFLVNILKNNKIPEKIDR